MKPAQYLEDPSEIEDPELEELMRRAEDLVVEAYTEEAGAVEEAYSRKQKESSNNTNGFKD